MFSWSQQVVLLTGGTGSFGQAFTRFLLKKHPPKVLRIFSRDEYKQNFMQETLQHSSLRYFIGDVRDKERLSRAMDGVTLVVHAAAMKQIVACEYNPTEAILTNVVGTMNILNIALDAGVKRVLGLITDKAVSPINLYGATKLCMEKLFIQGNAYRGKNETSISCVRYGNVAGSRGSVIPLFTAQAKKGLLTLTAKDATRFWIDLPTSVQFVIEAIEQMSGGEVFIPKMRSFNVIDLARAIDAQAKIKITGLRPGEKLHEDLITTHESAHTLEFKDHYVITPQISFWKNTKNKFHGKKVEPDFSYSSKNNSNFLTIPMIKDFLKRNYSDS